MAEIITKIKDFFEEIKFLLHDNTTRYGLTKEERIKIMEEHKALQELRNKEIKDLVSKYKTTEEYISAGFFKKLWLDMEYGIIYDHRGEFRFDPERKRWCYINGKTIIVLNEHFAENGKTFKELWLNAFLYEAEQIEKNERANGEKT
jgi:hypothetical protein